MTATTHWHDPVVAEIHSIRERLAEHYHNDLLAYSEAAEAHCRALGLNMAEDQHHAVPIAPISVAAARPAQPDSPADAVR